MFFKGVLYTVGRMIAYTALGVILIVILKEGASVFGVQKAVSKWGEMLIGPMLLLIGLFMLLGNRLNLPKIGFVGNGDSLASKGGVGALLLGFIFALAFCPTSGILYFGMLIPMSVTTTGGWLLPVLYAIATALPVLVVAWLLAFSIEKVSKFYGMMQTVQKWINVTVALIFLATGIYYCVINFL